MTFRRVKLTLWENVTNILLFVMCLSQGVRHECRELVVLTKVLVTIAISQHAILESTSRYLVNCTTVLSHPPSWSSEIRVRKTNKLDVDVDS
jgi:hypothetical protein